MRCCLGVWARVLSLPRRLALGRRGRDESGQQAAKAEAVACVCARVVLCCVRGAFAFAYRPRASLLIEAALL